MKPEDIEETGEILKSVSGKNRFYTYLHLYQGKEPKHIAHELDITRNAVQHYITDWKELELLTSEGNEYVYTDLGEKLVKQLNRMNSLVLGEAKSLEELGEVAENMIEENEERMKRLRREENKHKKL